MRDHLQIYRGSYATAPSMGRLITADQAYIAVKGGIIEGIYEKLPEKFKGAPVTDLGSGILIPAFSDLHIHASQFTERGVGMDCLLFDWLNSYTFPQEAKFASPSYAERVYRNVIRELLLHGTMHACFFTTIHYDACHLFFELLKESGMYAFCGKVNMDRNSPPYLKEDTEESIRLTDRFVSEHSGDPRVKPILTPRFAPTSSEQLLKGLSRIGKMRHVGIQTHLVESRAESEWTKELFPDYRSDGDIYERLGFLDNGPSVFAHVIFPEETDLAILKKHGSMSVHCPDATTNITAGIMPVSAMAGEGLPLSIGSDIGGGHFAGIYRQVGRAVQLSKMKEFYEPDVRRITFQEAFYMATAGGGSLFGEVGQIREGYRFNALVISGLEDEGVKHTVSELVERFCYIGDDRNITRRFLDGREILL